MKAVVITGASTGIGRTTALQLAQQGYQVFAGVRKTADGEALQAAAAPGSQLTPVMIDVRDQQTIDAAKEQIADACNGAGIWGLVNNAGVAKSGPVECIDMAGLELMFDTNLFGAVRMIKSFLPLVRQQQGRVVNVSSGAGRLSTPIMGGYSASKFGLEAISDALRIETRKAGIKVAVVEPGVIDTPIHDKNFPDMDQAIARLDDTTRQFYADGFVKFKAMNERFAQKATPSEKVAAAIGHALSAKRPKTRYAVGPDAKFIELADRLLPDRLKDALFGSAIGF